MIINYIAVVKMRSDKWFIYCQQRRTWQQQVHFPYNIDPFSGLFNFFIYMIKEIKFRIKKQTYMLLNIFPCHWCIVKINSSMVTCFCFPRENKLLSLFWGIWVKYHLHQEIFSKSSKMLQNNEPLKNVRYQKV